MTALSPVPETPVASAPAVVARSGPQRGLAVIAAALLAIGVAAALRLRGPAPRGLDAPGDVFSAGRARAALSDVFGPEAPHPVGTAANAAVRERILARLRALGWQPRLQRGWGCSRKGVCARVENIVAERPGSGAQRAILLAVHYDSVAAGPGASDDGAGVGAALEIARILAGEGPRRNAIALLLDEGEEAGLVGAEVFTASDPLAARVGAVINLEARGTAGPSLMFENSPHAAWLIDTFARVASTPTTSSLFPMVYEKMPNNTDFSVFKRARWEGVNFAFIGGAPRYHTPIDDLAHLSDRSLQHHGDNALALVRALADADLRAHPVSDAVHFDLFAALIVRWPVRATAPLALATLALLVLTVVRLRRVAPVRALRRATLGVLEGLVGAALAGAGLAALLRISGAAPTPWVAHPAPALLALAAVAVAGVLAVARRRVGPLGGLLAVAVVTTALSVLVAFLAPAASFLVLPGALVLTATLLVRSLVGRPALEPIAAGLASAVSAAILLPHALLLHDGLGVGAFVPVAILLTLVLAPAAALVRGLSPRFRLRALGAVGAVGAVALVVAVAQSPYSPSMPRPLDLLRIEELDHPRALFAVEGPADALPEAMRPLARWQRRAAPLLPWAAATPHLEAPAETGAPLPRPRLEPLPGDGRPGRRRLLLQSRSGATGAGLSVPEGARVESISVDGWPVDPRLATLPSGWLRVSTWTLPPEGITIDLTVRGAGALDVVVDEDLPGPPRGAAALLAARGPLATAIHQGDRTIAIARGRIP